MDTNLTVYLKGKIKRCGTLRHDDTLALGGICYDIIIVKRGCNTIHVLDLLTACGNLLEHVLELLEPVGDVCLGTLGNTSVLRLAYHTLR